ncbi:MAG: hypothetical protein PHW67_01975 [Bacilli bacterium]|nr:hypothetical protein [Bacilli bacterium]
MDKKTIKDLVLSSAAYSLSSILGPLLFFAVPAYFLDKHFGTKPMILLSAIFVAFIITNVLLYKKVQKINLMIETQYPKKDPKQEDEKTDESFKNNLD